MVHGVEKILITNDAGENTLVVTLVGISLVCFDSLQTARRTKQYEGHLAGHRDGDLHLEPASKEVELHVDGSMRPSNGADIASVSLSGAEILYSY